jgi:DmsE family decaheme c-type cytochrome
MHEKLKSFVRATNVSQLPFGVAILLLALVTSGFAGQTPSVDPKAGAPIAVSDQEECTSCHRQIVLDFASNPHRNAAAQAGHSDGICASCHGPGQPHIDGKGDRTKIFSPATADAHEINRRCLECHSGQLAAFPRSVHDKANLSCISCHSVHRKQGGQALLEAQQPALCLQCHAGTKADFSLPSHHKVMEGDIVCSDCHNPHSIVPRETRTVADLNATCSKCHAKEAGPFRYEHKAVSVEGCVACHSAHGSANIHLLNQNSVNALCELCHSVAGNASHAGLMAPSGHADARATHHACCTDCHAGMHGSNESQALLK